MFFYPPLEEKEKKDIYGKNWRKIFFFEQRGGFVLWSSHIPSFFLFFLKRGDILPGHPCARSPKLPPTLLCSLQSSRPVCIYTKNFFLRQKMVGGDHLTEFFSFQPLQIIIIKNVLDVCVPDFPNRKWESLHTHLSASAPPSKPLTNSSYTWFCLCGQSGLLLQDIPFCMEREVAGKPFLTPG